MADTLKAVKNGATTGGTGPGRKVIGPHTGGKSFPTEFASFAEFYPYYLDEHLDRTCKTLHFVGAAGVILSLSTIVATGQWKYFWILPIFGYGLAWVGHFVFEKNRPASFKQPLYSLRGDFAMFWDLLTGRLSFATGAKRKA